MTRQQRVTRTPIRDTRRKILTVNGAEPGYFYRFVNDVGDNVKRRLEQGYEIVEDPNISIGDRRVAVPSKEGTPVQSVVGTNKDGSSLRAFLMRIKNEWREEDDAIRNQRTVDLEAGIVQGAKAKGFQGDVKVERD